MSPHTNVFPGVSIGLYLLLLFAATPAGAQTTAQRPDGKAGYEQRPGFAGPSSVAGQLEEDDRVKEPLFRFPALDGALVPWFDWKGRVRNDYGLELGFDVNILYQKLGDSLTNETAAMGSVLRAFGLWTIVGRGTNNDGSLFFKVEQRNSPGTELAPASLGEQAGYIGITGLNFTDAGLLLGDFNWQQRLNDGRAGLIVGRFDPNDYVNVLGYGNPWSTFSNLSTLVDTSLALPDWSWGVGAGTWLNERWYVLGTINDANGSATNLKFFDGGGEFIKLVEVGWSPRDERLFKNVHITAWHVDARDEAGIDSAKGVSVGGNWTWNETWMIFARGGVSNGDAPIYNASTALGVGRLFRTYSDVLGVVTSWGDPPDDALDAQTTTEVFYRVTISQNLQLTPSLQWLHKPALNPEQSNVFLFGLRLRLAL